MQTSLKQQLQDIIASSRATEVGLAAHRMMTGEEILIDADRRFHPASTIKLCVMLGIFQQAQQGKLSLEQELTIRNEFTSLVGGIYALDVQDDSETELYERLGQNFPIRELLRRMIVVSSNLATNNLISLLNLGQVNKLMQELGTADVVLLRGLEDKQAYRQGLNSAATARGLMQLLLKIARREAVSPAASDEMLGILSGQKFNEMIPARLPSGTRVAHKTGWASDYHHDAGIVYPPGSDPFVLAIMTKGYSEAEDTAAHAFVASLAKTVYDAWAVDALASA